MGELLQPADALQGSEAAAPEAEKAELSALGQGGRAAAGQVVQGHRGDLKQREGRSVSVYQKHQTQLREISKSSSAKVLSRQSLLRQFRPLIWSAWFLIAGDLIAPLEGWGVPLFCIFF